MGQFFTLAPVYTGFRCSRSDYGATEAVLLSVPAYLILLFGPSRLLRSFPITLRRCVSVIRKFEGQGRLRHV